MDPLTIDPTFLAAWRKGFSPPERLNIPEFASRYISLPASYAIPGTFDVSRSRYMLEIFSALADPRVRLVVVQAAVQCGKSLLADLFVPWVIVNACGSILWLTADEDLAKKYAETRLNPVLYGTEPVKSLLPSNRFAKRKTSIVFPNHTALIVGGANEGNVQSLSVRYLVLDEAWLYKAGILSQALARVKAFPNNSKVLVISQAGEEGHDFSELYKTGHCAEWGWTCPQCQTVQPYHFNERRADGTYGGLQWDRNETTKPNGVYNLVEVGKTVCLSCIKCAHKVTDAPTNRRQLNDGGAYLATNPNADPAVRSFTFNALANIDISFSSVASEYLTAKSAERSGYLAPLKQFHQKVLAKPWNPSAQLEIIKGALAEYDPAQPWTDAAFTFLTVDVQRTEFWAVVRAWALNGDSRLLFAGRLNSWAEVKEVQDRFKIKDQCVFVDSGYAPSPNQVYQECVKHGHWGKKKGVQAWICWNAVKGDKAEDYLHTDAKGNKVRLFYSEPKLVNPGFGQYGSNTGQRCAFIVFSSKTASDILHKHYSGKAAKFLSAKDDPVYTAHMNSERRVRDENGKWIWEQIGKRPNHIWDCEKINITAAAMAGVLAGVETKEAAPAVTDPAPAPADTL